MLPAPTYIVSDLHLGLASLPLERRFCDFLDAVAPGMGALVVNGDLFDFWFEWRSVIPRAGFRALAAIARLADRGIPVHWIAGNHDCWGGDVLRTDVGAAYHPDGWRGTIAGWESWIHHGDGLRGDADRRYRRLRAVIRHPLSIRAFRALHPDWGSRLASGSSAASRHHGSHDEGAGLQQVAFARLAGDPRLDLVVFGHSHVAALTRSPTGGIYANPGSWLDAPTYLRVTAERIELRRFDGSAEGDRVHVLDRAAEEAPPEP